jgi:hypothetical protein
MKRVGRKYPMMIAVTVRLMRDVNVRTSEADKIWENMVSSLLLNRRISVP